MALNLAIQWDKQVITNKERSRALSCVVSVFVSVVMFALLNRGALYAGGLPPLAPSWRNPLPNTYRKNINKLPSLLLLLGNAKRSLAEGEPLFTIVECFYNCTMVGISVSVA